MSLILDGSNGLSDVDGSASTPAIRGTDANTGIFFPAADTIAFAEGGAEVARIDSSGQLGIGTTSPTVPLQIYNATNAAALIQGDAGANITIQRYSTNATQPSLILFKARGTLASPTAVATGDQIGSVVFQAYGGTNTRSIAGIRAYAETYTSDTDISSYLWFGTTPSGTTTIAERMRIDSAGEVLIGKTSTASSVAGIRLNPLGTAVISRNDELLFCNRLTTDGALVQFQQDGTSEGNISVSGTTVSYNGGHLSRWSQLPDGSKDESIVKGTVMSNLDDMCVWEKDGVVAENEQLNKMKVSDVEGDTNVAGVFVNWTIDADYGVDDMNVAMTGDMIIRIAEGVVVQKGDLLMSAGDGTAKPQGDDIVRSKTIAKVTSNHVTCTYADGSYCVPCVLMAC